MKKIVLLIISLVSINQTIAQTVVLDANNVTVKWTGTSVPLPYFVQANPRGTGMEWFAIVDNSTTINISNYAKNIQSGITFFTRPSTTTPIPFDNIVTTLVTNMNNIIGGNGSEDFNQPIGSWDVSNVTNMSSMFSYASAFNQNIGAWNVSNVTNMSYMFMSAYAFNQNIGSWNVSNVINMIHMFQLAKVFNQNIGSWNVSNVTNMKLMFTGAYAFNQPIGSWNVSNVSDMSYMFYETTAFNQSIGSWNVSNVSDMSFMFAGANSFNQSLGFWNVSNVINMQGMFFYGSGLSTANYDATIIGWSTITPPETALKPNVPFNAGNSKYCNSTSARASIISTYGWSIVDGGLDCLSLDTEEFETNSLKLYPNPVVSVLNVKTDSNLINQTYTIIDGLGRVVLNGKLNEVDSTINVEQLSKGIYYLKLSDKNASKFIKE